MVALTLPSHPNASAWLEDAVTEFRWMLKNGVMSDGQWCGATATPLSAALVPGRILRVPRI